MQEFAALKVGDKIEVLMSGQVHGTVTEALDSGVRVRWGDATEGGITFHYSVQGTAWMHWSKAEDSTGEPTP